MDITERFLNYTKFDTQSSEESENVPSTSKQLLFAEYLKKELERVQLTLTIVIEKYDTFDRTSLRSALVHGRHSENGRGWY